MQHKIYYANNKGDVLDFTSPYPNPYRMVSGTPMDYEWEYNASADYRLRGEKITAFRQSAKTMEISLDVFAGTQQLYLNAVNRLHDVADYDVSVLKPGRLYVNGSYLNCYICASQKSRWERPALFLSVTLTLVAEYPSWWTEEHFSFSCLDYEGSEAPDEFVLSVSGTGTDYPWDYARGDLTSRIIDNAYAYKPSPFLLRIYGPVSNPHLVFGEVSYDLTLELLTQEYVEVNSFERTIVKKNELTGLETNVFGSGSIHIFDPLPPGRFSMTYSGQFSFELVLLQRRAEPLWTS